jgi:putative peptidoglycan lipid II flippase
VLAPAFYSRDNYKMTTIASVVSMTLNTGLNAILVMGFGLGAISVALATSASAWVNFMILAGSLWKSGFGFKNPELARKYLPAND